MNYIFLLTSFFMINSCSTYDQFTKLEAELEIPSQVFKSSFQEVWSATVGVMKDFDISTQDQEIGLIKTRWMENTTDINFTDSFSSQDKIKSARYKLIVNVNSTSSVSDDYVKVTIIKRQLVESDYLQGWREVKNDKSLENTLLYRIKRLLKLEKYLKKVQEDKEKEQLKEL